MENVLKLISCAGLIEVDNYFNKIINNNSRFIIEELVSFFGEKYRNIIEEKYKNTTMIFYFDLSNSEKLKNYFDNYLFNLRYESTINILNELKIDTSCIKKMTIKNEIIIDNKEVEDFIRAMFDERILIYNFEDTNVYKIYEDSWLKENIIEKYIYCIGKGKDIFFARKREIEAIKKIYETVKKYADKLSCNIDDAINAEQVLSPLYPGTLLGSVANSKTITKSDIVYNVYNIYYNDNNCSYYSSNLRDQKINVYNIFTLDDNVLIKEIVNSITSELLIIDYEDISASMRIKMNKTGIAAYTSFANKEYINFNDIINNYIATSIVDKLHEKNIFMFKNHLLKKKDYTKYNFMVELLFKEYKEDFTSSLINVSCHELEEKIGRDNLEKIVHLYTMSSNQILDKENKDGIIKKTEKIMAKIKSYHDEYKEVEYNKQDEVKVKSKIKVIKN